MTLHRLNTSFANVLPLQRGDYNVANKTRDAGACMRKDTSQKIHPKKNEFRRSGQSSDVVGRGVAMRRSFLGWLNFGLCARPWCARITFIQPIEAARPTEPDKTYLNSNHPQKPAYPTTATTPHCTLRHGS